MALTDDDLDRIERCALEAEEESKAGWLYTGGLISPEQTLDLVAEVRRLRAIEEALVVGARGTLNFAGLPVMLDESQPRDVVTVRSGNESIDITLARPAPTVDTCPATWAGVRCDLPAGHEGHHDDHNGSTWPNRPAVDTGTGRWEAETFPADSPRGAWALQAIDNLYVELDRYTPDHWGLTVGKETADFFDSAKLADDLRAAANIIEKETSS